MSNRMLVKFVLPMLVLGFCAVYMPFPAQAAVFLNFPPPPDERTNAIIIDGTSLFLQSNASVYLLLNEVEMAEKQGLNYTYALNLADAAAEKLRQAKDKYIEAISVEKRKTLTRAMTQRYKYFDYMVFADANKMNREVMMKVSEFLKNANFAGVIEKSVTDIDDILTLIDEIRVDLANGIKPDLQQFRLLMQKYSTLSLFGNYATTVFNTVM